MKPETIAKARTMLSSVLLDGLSYREAGAPFGVGRSTVERSIKSLVLEVARERGIPELDEDGLSCLPLTFERVCALGQPVVKQLVGTALHLLGCGYDQVGVYSANRTLLIVDKNR